MRNNTINCLKFIFAVVIALFHFEIYPTIKGGYLGVEFFLTVSGYYAAKRIMESPPAEFPAKTAFAKTLSALKKIYPTLLISTIIAFIVGIYVGNISASDLKYIVYELIPVMHTGLRGVWYQNVPLWYFSAYILVLPLFLYALERSRDFFYSIGAVVIPIAVYACFCVNYGCLDVVFAVVPSLLRIFAGLCLGADCYKLSQFISFKQEGKSYGLYAAGLLLMSLNVLLMRVFPKDKLDFAVALLIMTALAFVFGSRVDFKLPISDFLGKWSVSIFCTHYIVYHIVVNKWLENKQDTEQWFVIYLALTALLSLVIFGVSVLVRKLGSVIFGKRKRGIDGKSAAGS